MILFILVLLNLNIEFFHLVIILYATILQFSYFYEFAIMDDNLSITFIFSILFNHDVE